MDQTQWEEITKDGVFAAFYEHVGVQRQVFLKTQETYHKEQEKMQQF